MTATVPPLASQARAGAAKAVELKLGSQVIHTVFDLLGDKEDDMTYAIGWGLARSHAFTDRLLTRVYGHDVGSLTAIELQRTERETGRTDVEIVTQRCRLVIEAKRGWTVPSLSQLRKYAQRLKAERDSRDPRLLVVAEAAPHFPPVRQLLSSGPIEGVPVDYLSWEVLASAVAATAQAVRSRDEKGLLRELHRYLRRLMRSQRVTSNMVYVVSLNGKKLDWSKLTFIDTVMRRDLYYHPVGGPGQKWPKTPPNYLGFRFDGQLQRISHVEDYTVIARPHEHIPEIAADVDWSDQPHFLYRLGPPLPLPQAPVRSTRMWNRRVEVALDLLLTSDTITAAHEKTRERLAQAGEDV